MVTKSVIIDILSLKYILLLIVDVLIYTTGRIRTNYLMHVCVYIKVYINCI